MTRDLWNTIILASSFLLLFGIAEFIYHKLHVRAELTRKLVHVMTGLLTLLFPVMLNNHWLVLLLCTAFAVILVLSLRFNLLNSVNAIDRKSVGSLAYPVAVYGCYLAYEYGGKEYLFYYLPILTLAICDPIAAITGKRWPIGKYKVGKDNKTMMGSAMFLLSALVLSIAFGQNWLAALTIATVATLAEAVSPRGLDNISIPASVIGVLYLL